MLDENTLGGCGLIVDVHGLFNSPSKQDSNTHLWELGRNAVSRGALTPYIVIQPKAPNGLTGWSLSDAPYVQGFIENIAKSLAISDVLGWVHIQDLENKERREKVKTFLVKNDYEISQDESMFRGSSLKYMKTVYSNVYFY